MNNQQKSIVKASFYVSPSLEETRLLSESACYLPICVGQSCHEGEKLRATLELIEKKFASCTIVLADTLERYNTEEFFSGNYEAAYNKSLRYGNDWIEKNHRYYSTCSIPYKISRWDEWINHSLYMECKTAFDSVYETNPILKNAVDESIHEFILRLKNRNKEKEESYFNMRCTHSLNYLKEECAVMLLFAQARLGYEVYTAARSPVMSATYDLFIKSSYPLQLKQLVLRFKRTELLESAIEEQISL